MSLIAQKRLRELLQIQNGFAFKSSLFGDEGMPLIRIRDLKTGTSTETRYSGEYEDTSIVRAGDILIGMDGEFSCFEWRGEDALLNQRVCRIDVVGAELDRRYLLYGINSHLKEIETHTPFTTVKHISSRQILDIEFSYPPLTEQKRIVAILDEAFAGIAKATTNTQHNLTNARELFDARLSHTFETGGEGWLEQPLGNFVTIKHGFAFKSEYFTDAGDHVLLTPGNFFEHGGYRDRGQKQKCYDGPIPKGFVLEAGSLLVAMTEQAPGLLGSPLIVPDNPTFLHNQRLGLVEPLPNTPYVPELFEHLFNTKRFRAEVYRHGTGVKVRHTSPDKLRAVTIRIPPTRDEQRKVADVLSELKMASESLEKIYRKQKMLTNELKQSLLRQAFSSNPSKEAKAA